MSVCRVLSAKKIEAIKNTQLNAGDVVLISGRSLFALAIKWFTTSKGEKPSVFSHVGLVYGDAPVGEAMIGESWYVNRITALWKQYQGADLVEIWRDATLTESERATIDSELRDHVNQPYGVGAIGLAALDTLLAKIFKKPDNAVTFFRKLSGDDLVCSTVTAVIYAKIGRTFGTEPLATSPDDIGDYVREHALWAGLEKDRKWQLVCSWSKMPASKVVKK
jgi:hypothetical protein